MNACWPIVQCFVLKHLTSVKQRRSDDIKLKFTVFFVIKYLELTKILTTVTIKVLIQQPRPNILDST